MRVDTRLCEQCGSAINQRVDERPGVYATRRFCNTICLGAAKVAKRGQRFWSRVQAGTPDECWLWTGRRSERGYGQFATGDRQWRAHRYALISQGIDVPLGSVVMHTCDNPPCCNPAHLKVGTPAENNADMISKGRDRVVGVRHARARLTVEQVREIKFGRQSCRSLAKKYGIHFMHAWHIRRGDAWKSVTCE